MKNAFAAFFFTLSTLSIYEAFGEGLLGLNCLVDIVATDHARSEA
jgi:hypothetical protein